MNYLYFDVEHSIKQHDYIIEQSGGLSGIKNKGHLEAVLEFVKNDDPTQNGIDIIVPDSPVVNERDVTLTFLIKGTSQEAFLSNYAAFVAEFVFTFIFLMVILGSTSTKNINGGFAGLAIGFSLVLIHIVGIKVTGVSVNPARSIGPAIFAGGAALSQLWLFVVAPVLGGIAAAFTYNLLIERPGQTK